MRVHHWLAMAGIAAAMAAGVAQAATESKFDQAAFVTAQKAGKPILVHITAPWCPTCAKQHPIVSKLEAEPAYRDLMVFEVDFDTQKDVVKALGATTQSTLIVYRGADERGRSAGDTNAASIESLLAKSAS